MTLDDIVAPVAPRMRPVGPLVPASELEIWHNAFEARAAAERYLLRVRRWARIAYQRERERGRSEGMNRGAEEMARLIAQSVSEAARQKAALEQQLPQLVMQIVSDLLGAFDPGELLVSAVRHAIERKGGAEVRLKVCPTQADAVAGEFAAYDGREGRPKVRVDPDPALSPQQCVLWSDYGNVDLGLDAQLRALRLGFGLHAEQGEL
ncbi:type III secretion system stator protein SctL [Mesorhizobium sp. VK25A]|uniref:Type 3 secretion system stator protein n=1 Tax=Mesorhizobium vachelliae TaxID=3072309 RepID=A0ABU5A829_9HYPH|nr:MULTISPECIES: type III secretion system stator protein SctL [unclassified Mesorhizobium]MDX8443980.1 type III secretion system stator protein SctL [Mesorhizobium sp. VK3C]MDX8509908.1 type III secretion system stator protein SctL [Mesorhizobium sp. VK22E]MDX8533871.1 type III secretion system stator protein SctL [Mesorhizobium sp. VK25D]MDX8546658.1 type III secretion system stator protein SctL [Mesorhizobium sp. VK25A]